MEKWRPHPDSLLRRAALPGLFHRFGRCADDKILSHLTADIGNRLVLHADVNAVGADFHGDVYAVIDDERNIVLSAQLFYRKRFGCKGILGNAFFSELQHGYAVFQRSFNLFKKSHFANPCAVGNCI
jgi:hypothetical protein